MRKMTSNEIREVSENGLTVKLAGEDFVLNSDNTLVSIKQKEGYANHHPCSLQPGGAELCGLPCAFSGRTALASADTGRYLWLFRSPDHSIVVFAIDRSTEELQVGMGFGRRERGCSDHSPVFKHLFLD